MSAVPRASFLLLPSQRTALFDGAIESLQNTCERDRFQAFVSNIDPRFADVRDRMLCKIEPLMKSGYGNNWLIHQLKEMREDSIGQEALAIFADVLQTKESSTPLDDRYHPNRPPQRIADIITTLLDPTAPDEALNIYDDVMQRSQMFTNDERVHPMRPLRLIADIMTSFIYLSYEDLSKLSAEEALHYLNACSSQMEELEWSYYSSSGIDKTFGRFKPQKHFSDVFNDHFEKYRLFIDPAFPFDRFISSCTSLKGIKFRSLGGKVNLCEVQVAFKHLRRMDLGRVSYYDDRDLAFTVDTCPNLEAFRVDNSSIEDLSPLRRLPALTSLALHDLRRPPKNFSVLCDLKALRELEFSIYHYSCSISETPPMTYAEADAYYRWKDLPFLMKLTYRSPNNCNCHLRALPYVAVLESIMPAIEMRKEWFDHLEETLLSDQEKAGLVNPLVQLIDIPHPKPLPAASVSDDALNILRGFLEERSIVDVILSYFNEEELTGTAPEFTKARLMATLSQLQLSSEISPADIRDLVFGFTDLHRTYPELFNAGFTPLRFVLNHVTQNGERIKTLDLSNSNITEKNLSKYLTLFPKVEILRLDHCSNLTNEAMQQLATVKDTLRVLGINGVPITDFSFVKNLPHLEEIGIGGDLNTNERDLRPLFDHPGIVLLTMDHIYYLEPQLDNRLKALPQKIREAIKQKFEKGGWEWPIIDFADELTKALKQARRPKEKPARIKGLEG